MAKLNKIIHVPVEPKMKRQLEEMAEQQHVPVTWVIRQILRAELEKQPQTEQVA
jgi:predicted transcriptional regulator